MWKGKKSVIKDFDVSKPYFLTDKKNSLEVEK